MTDEILLPCPFCGGDAYKWEDDDVVGCPTCSGALPVAKWNTRAPAGYAVVPIDLESATLREIAVVAHVAHRDDRVPIAIRAAILKYHKAMLRVTNGKSMLAAQGEG